MTASHSKMIKQVESGDGFTIEFYIDRFHVDPNIIEELECLSTAKYDPRTMSFVQPDGTYVDDKINVSTTMINALINSFVNISRINAKDIIKNSLLDKCSERELKELQREIQKHLLEKI